MFTVSKGEPIPAPRVKYPFKTMEVGDFFIVPDPQTKAKIVVAAHTHGHVNNKKFRSKTENGVTRIWRVA